MKKFISLLIIFSGLFLMACFNKSSKGVNEVVIMRNEEAIENLTIGVVGSKTKLTSNQKNGAWSISNTSIAEVQQDGTIKGLSVGKTKLTYVVNGNPKVIDIFVVPNDSNKYLYIKEIGNLGHELGVWGGHGSIDVDIKKDSYNKAVKVDIKNDAWMSLVFGNVETEIKDEFDRIKFKIKSDSENLTQIKVHIMGKEKEFPISEGALIGDGWYEITGNLSEFSGNFNDEKQVAFIHNVAGAVFYVTDVYFEKDEVVTPPDDGDDGDKPKSEWKSWQDGDKITIEEENGVLIAEVKESGGDSYNPKVFKPVDLTDGKTYTASFSAKADIARDIKVNIGTQFDSDPWFKSFAGEVRTFSITTEFQEYTFEFTSNNQGETEADIIFELGAGVATKIFIKDVSITEKTSDDGGSDGDDDDDEPVGENNLVVNSKWVDETSSNANYLRTGGEIIVDISTISGGQWDDQITNEVQITEEGDYVVKFTASSTVDRDVLFRVDAIELNGMGTVGPASDVICSLTSTPQEFTINVSAEAFAANPRLKIIIALGTLEAAGTTSVASTVTLNNFYLGLKETSNEEPIPVEGKISLFNSNDQSEDIAIANWNPHWGQGGSLTEEEKDGATVKKLHLVNYQGVSIDEVNGINITGKTTLHMDIWTTDGGPFNVFAVSMGNHDGPAVSTGELTPNQWNTVKLNFSGAVDKTKIIQLKFDGGTDSIYYLDNIYFDESENGDSDNPNPVNPAIGPLYTAESGAIHTNISVPDWGNGSTITNLAKAMDGYDNVLEVSMGAGWGGAGVPNGMSAAVGFNGFTAGTFTGITKMSLKFKYTNTNAIPPNVEVQLIGAANQTVVVHETGVGGTWTSLSDGWVRVEPNISEFGNLNGVTQIVLIVKDDASNPVYFTDIYFE